MTIVLSIPVVIPFLIIALVTINAVMRYRRIRRTTLFRHLSFVVRQNLPLISALYASSHREPTGIRFPLRRLSRMLESGIPLGDAIGLAWPQCPRTDQSILQAAERAGTLPDALAVIDARYQRDFDARLTVDHNVLGLSSITAFAFILTYWIMQIWIVPKFRVILIDFDVAVPEFYHEILMTGLWAGSQPMTWYGLLFHITLLLIVFAIPLWLIWLPLSQLLKRVDFFSNLFDSMRWFVLPLRRAEIAEGCVLTLPIIRIATSAGWPLDRAIDIAATVRANVLWRHRLEDWAESIRSGNDTIKAGRAAKLPDTLMRYLAVGVRDGDLEAPLASAEQYFALLLDRHRRGVRVAIWLVSTLTVGAIVACLCTAFFLMMTALIDGAALQWWDI